MSTIEERIDRHSELMFRYEKKARNYTAFAIHNTGKAEYHRKHIEKLKSKQAKQENKEIR